GSVEAARAPNAPRHPRVFLLRLDLVAVPELASIFLPTRVHAQSRTVRSLLIGGIFRRRRGRSARRHDERRGPPAYRRSPQGSPQRRRPWIYRLVPEPAADLH